MYIVSYLLCFLNILFLFIVYKDHSMNFATFIYLVLQYYTVICHKVL